MDKKSVSIDSALRNIFIPKQDVKKAREPPTKHGGFEALYVKDYIADQKTITGPNRYDTIRASSDFARSQHSSSMNHTISTAGGFLYGRHLRDCREKHLHGRTCTKNKLIDIAELQSKAFKYLILQKPKESKPIVPQRLKVEDQKKC